MEPLKLSGTVRTINLDSSGRALHPDDEPTDGEGIERAASLRVRAQLLRDRAMRCRDEADYESAKEFGWQADELDEMAEEAHFHLSPADSRAAWDEWRASMARHHARYYGTSDDSSGRAADPTVDEAVDEAVDDDDAEDFHDPYDDGTTWDASY